MFAYSMCVCVSLSLSQSVCVCAHCVVCMCFCLFNFSTRVSLAFSPHRIIYPFHTLCTIRLFLAIPISSIDWGYTAVDICTQSISIEYVHVQFTCVSVSTTTSTMSDVILLVARFHCLSFTVPRTKRKWKMTMKCTELIFFYVSQTEWRLNFHSLDRQFSEILQLKSNMMHLQLWMTNQQNLALSHSYTEDSSVRWSCETMNQSLRWHWLNKCFNYSHSFHSNQIIFSSTTDDHSQTHNVNRLLHPRLKETNKNIHQLIRCAIIDRNRKSQQTANRGNSW